VRQSCSIGFCNVSVASFGESIRILAGKQTTRLTHYGRKTGNPNEVTIWFVLDGDELFIGTANVKRQWVRNVQKTPKVKLSIGGESFEGTARSLAAFGLRGVVTFLADSHLEAMAVGCFG
jgi:deazaflavin-dependent oxidoreductase (nitroreductase family)